MIMTQDNFQQAQINIGTLGHVDHGKTTLTRAITGVWTDRHSESIKRSMTIKLGYADALIKKCEGCDGPSAYTIGDSCEQCAKKNVKPTPIRRFSILDAPGHETLMATAIAGSSIIDAVMFVIAATEPCPMPQTREHLMLLNILNIKTILIIQTKVDVVGKDKAKAHYNQIRDFLKGSVAENAPIIPVMANKNINIDAVLEFIANMEVPKRDSESDTYMYIARSFDANKPGTKIEDLVGGVIGGSIVRGKLKVGDEIEIRPGIGVQKEKGKRETYIPILTKIESLSTSTGKIEEAIAGGLIGLSTDIDPAFAKADGLAGNVVGKVGKLPPTLDNITLEYHMIKRPDIGKQAFTTNEPVILGVGTATTVGYVTQAKKNTLKIQLKRPICADKTSKISVLRNFQQRWRLSGYGLLIS